MKDDEKLLTFMGTIQENVNNLNKFSSEEVVKIFRNFGGTFGTSKMSASELDSLLTTYSINSAICILKDARSFMSKEIKEFNAQEFDTTFIKIYLTSLLEDNLHSEGYKYE